MRLFIWSAGPVQLSLNPGKPPPKVCSGKITCWSASFDISALSIQEFTGLILVRESSHLLACSHPLTSKTWFSVMQTPKNVVAIGMVDSIRFSRYLAASAGIGAIETTFP